MTVSEDIRIKPAHLAALIIALFGGNTLLTAQWTKQDVVRPDPFTGSQGRVLEEQVKSLKNQVELLQKHGPDGVRAEIENLRRRLDDCVERRGNS